MFRARIRNNFVLKAHLTINWNITIYKWMGSVGLGGQYDMGEAVTETPGDHV